MCHDAHICSFESVGGSAGSGKSRVQTGDPLCECLKLAERVNTVKLSSSERQPRSVGATDAITFVADVVVGSDR